MRLDKLVSFNILLPCIVYGQNLNYTENDMQTLTLPKQTITFSYSYLLMNDTVDILKIKESEFGGNSNFDAMGDLSGEEFKVRYGLANDLTISYRSSVQSIEFGNNNMNNKKDDIFLRYNFFNNKYTTLSSGISLDMGYTTNKLTDYYMRDKEQIKTYVNRIPIDELVSSSDQVGQFTANDPEVTKFNPFGTNPNIGDYYFIQDGSKILIDDISSMIDDVIDLNSYVALKDTSDSSYYLRLLTGYYLDKSLMNFYIGYKETNIKNTIEGNIQSVIIKKELNRKEKMYLAGINYTLESKKYIYEFGLEYDKFKRDEGLDYIDYNVIIDGTLSYKYNDHILLYAGAKLMYRQLNGQIPYLYNKYTQTTYDHKYGYTKFGVQYRF